MKKMMLFVSIMLFISDLAIAQTSSLSIVSENEPFILYLNATNVSPMANTVAVVHGLRIGRNHIRIAFVGKGIPELNAQLELADDGKIHQLAYKVVKDTKGKQFLKLISDNIITSPDQHSQQKKLNGNASTNTSAAYKSDASVNINANQTGNASTNIQTQDGNTELQVAVSQNGVSMNLQIPEEKKATNTNESTFSSQIPGVDDGLMCTAPSVDAQTFLKFKYKLSSVSMEMYKAKDIKEFMNKQCMLASQVAELVKMIEMNDYQYEVAQLGYLRTYDQANYGVVVDALMADFNKEKLINFIGSNQTKGSALPIASKKSTPVDEDINEKENIQQQPSPTPSYNTTSVSSSCIAMESNEFDEALEAVDEPINEDNKMEVAKSVFDQECLNTNQVYRVLELFIDEDRKLDFAKFAFSRTSDKDKYFRLNKAFINENRITDLSNFVKKNR